MKIYWYLVIVCFISFGCNKRKVEIEFRGKIDSCDGTIVRLINIDNTLVYDSTFVKNKTFKFNSKLPKEGFYQVDFTSPVIKGMSWSHPCLIYAKDKGNYVFHASGPDEVLYNAYLIKSNSSDQNAIEQLKYEETQLSKQIKRQKILWLTASDISLQKGDNNSYKKYIDSISMIDSMAVAEDRALKKNLIASNLQSVYTPYLISQATDLFDNHVFYTRVLQKLSSPIQKSEYFKDAKERLAAASKLYKGAMAPTIAGKDLSGRNFALDYKNHKFTLLNFWASYCIPCRMEHPELKKMYSEFKEDGFNIVSISIDEKFQNWSLASQKDSLPWSNIAELTEQQYSKNIKNFAIKVIPANYLVDQQGKIVDRNISLEILRKRIREKVN